MAKPSPTTGPSKAGKTKANRLATTLRTLEHNMHGFHKTRRKMQSDSARDLLSDPPDAPEPTPTPKGGRKKK